jgi:hypothetical protein
MSLCHYGAQSKTSDNFQHFGTSRHKRRTLRGWYLCKRVVKYCKRRIGARIVILRGMSYVILHTAALLR